MNRGYSAFSRADIADDYEMVREIYRVKDREDRKLWFQLYACRYLRLTFPPGFDRLPGVCTFPFSETIGRRDETLMGIKRLMADLLPGCSEKVANFEMGQDEPSLSR